MVNPSAAEQVVVDCSSDEKGKRLWQSVQDAQRTLDATLACQQTALSSSNQITAVLEAMKSTSDEGMKKTLSEMAKDLSSQAVQAAQAAKQAAQALTEARNALKTANDEWNAFERQQPQSGLLVNAAASPDIGQRCLRMAPAEYRGLEDYWVPAISPLYYEDPLNIVPENDKLKALELLHCLRTMVTQHYEGKGGLKFTKDRGSCMATCCVTGCQGFWGEVDAVHLLPLTKPYDDTYYWSQGYTEVDNNDVRNYILLSKNIENAYGLRELSFIKQPLTKEDERDPTHAPHRYRMKIWDPAVCQEPLFEYQKQNAETSIYDLDGAPFGTVNDLSQHLVGDYEDVDFQLPADKAPCSRVLNFQAQSSYEMAIRKGWMKANEVPRLRPFGTPLRNDTIIYCRHEEASIQQDDTSAQAKNDALTTDLPTAAPSFNSSSCHSCPSRIKY